jgi:hypothetical protein|tara:strand:+ start:2184 stop:2750 length:567 start_codon:yes stop_codon:yes gene_type:complete
MPDIDVFAEIEKDTLANANIPQDAELSKVSSLISDLHQKQDQYSKQEAGLKQLKQEIQHMETRVIPDLMNELGVTEFTNTDGVKVTVRQFVSASIPKDRIEEAHQWLKDNGHGDLIKHLVSVDVGKQETDADHALKALSDLGLAPTDKESVHSQTLKAFVREQVESGEPLPLELFGAFLGQKATIKKG